MRFLILSDIHANWDALDAVLSRAEGRYDIILNCGDLVGYGPEPNRVVDWCRATNAAVVRGNHDKAASGSRIWTGSILSPRLPRSGPSEILTEENRLYLATLPVGPRIGAGLRPISRVAASMKTNTSSSRRMSAESAPDHTLSFFGHTHLQGGFFTAPDWRVSAGSSMAFHRGDRGLSRQSRIGRPAARPRPARGIRHLRFGAPPGANSTAPNTMRD